ncbi:hypothetical protein [Streptomyces sp. NBC_00094]|uniref:hypothetical protein n=1 Tax=Streptomyces sp. NBC_00094 TaxID=2903620 RepID=UPI0022574DB1|nr:hypothetical protein [Streptomyces sp. NBC_00094]MCX5392295.1 hypothetical protein [Streptomyces sp. NBC_00094]
MAIEPTGDEQALVDQYALPWIEANEDRSSDADVHLRSYASSLENDGADATKAVERLLSSGRGEAMKALDEHWARVHAYFGRTARAAVTIASGIGECGDVIVVGKHRAQDLIAHFAAVRPTVGNDAQHRMLQQQADATRRDLRESAATALSDTRAGAARAQADPDVATLGTIPAHLAGLLGGGAGGGLGQGIGTGIAAGVAGISGGVGAGVAGISGGVGAGVAGIAGGGGRAGMTGDGGGAGDGGVSGGAGPQVGANARSWNVFVDHDEHKRAADGLTRTAENIRGKTTTTLARARFDLDALAASGSLGASIAADYAPLLDHLDSATQALAGHLHGPLRNLVLSMSTGQKKTDEANRDRLGRLDRG